MIDGEVSGLAGSVAFSELSLNGTEELPVEPETTI